MSLCGAALCWAAVGRSSELTVVLDFKGPHSEKSVAAMKHETQQIFNGTGLRLDWKSREEAARSTSPDLVYIRFNGRCEFPPPPLYDELGETGPLASTYETDGEIQPFSEVSCDRVGALVRSGLHGGDAAKGEQLIGKALGRVIAHELVHILTGSAKHGKEGVFEPALSAQQLIAGELVLGPADIDRLRSRL